MLGVTQYVAEPSQPTLKLDFLTPAPQRIPWVQRGQLLSHRA